MKRLLALMVCVLLLTSCAASAETQRYTASFLDVFDTASQLVIYADSQEEANRLQLLRGERLYEELPHRREEIDRAIMEFERVLQRQDRTEIEKARKALTRTLDAMEFGLT